MNEDHDHANPLGFSDQFPHDPARSAAQIEGLRELLDGAPKRIADLGCGVGRILVPLAEAGHQLIGVDHSADLLARCAATLKSRSATAKLVQADFMELPDLGGPFDAVLCLGNTLMTVADVDAAIGLTRMIALLLRPGGAFIIDDFPHELWPELTEGNWLAGISEDGEMQMVWEPGDAVFAIRRGDEIDEERWELKPTDRKYRLWSLGALELLARLAGLSAPAHLPQAGLLVMRRTCG